MKLFAGIEAGGTKFVCAVGNGEGKILHRVIIPTTTPEETLPKIIEFFKSIDGNIVAFGIGSFGPINNHKGSSTYGYITSTPKIAWVNYNLLGTIQDAFQVPVGFTTDVTAAALGEYEWGAAQQLTNLIYMTVGTGIGAASIINGKTIPGMGHQEIGHMLIPHDKEYDPFIGICPYHHDCLEGLACGGAIKQRWEVPSALDLPVNHPAWDLQADYLAAALMNCILTLTPERIIMGGGVMRQMHLFPKIRNKVLQKLNGYITESILINHIDEYIVPPGLADRAGVVGAIALARQTFHEENVNE